MTRLVDIIRRLSAVTYAIGAIAIAMMMLQITAHVFFQYVFSSPLPGTYLFVSNYYMVVVTFLCLAAVELKGAHISVDLLASRLSETVQGWLAILSETITAVVFAMLAWQSLMVAESRRAAGSFEIEYGTKILIWPSYYLVPAGAALFALVAVVKLLARVTGTPVTVPDTSGDLH